MLHKTIGSDQVKIKNADLGEIEVVFATFDVVDKDGDIASKSAMTDGAKAIISPYEHSSVKAGVPPVGYGTIELTDTEAVFKGQYMMDTPEGRSAFLTVKSLHEQGIGEWSYALREVKSERDTVDGRSVNRITSVTIPEVSPVLVGAGMNTRTLTAKSGSDVKQLNSDVHAQLRDLGRERYADDDHWVYVEDFDVDESFVIFYVASADDTRLLRVGYTRDDDTITLNDDETEVEVDLSYSPKSGIKFRDELTAVLTAVKSAVDRGEAIADARVKSGKSGRLGNGAVSTLGELEALLVRLKALAPEPQPRRFVNRAVLALLDV